MKIGMVVAGVAFLGIGGAGAYFVPPIMQESAARRAETPLLTADSAKSAKVGDRVLLHGMIMDGNETFEKDLVIGHKQVWGVSSNPSEREAYRYRLQRNEDTSGVELKWWPEQEFKRLLHVEVEGVGDVALSPYSGVVGGDYYHVEDTVGDEKFRWEGARRADKVSAYVRVTGTDPLEVETQMGDNLFVGSSDALKQAEAKGDQFVMYAIYGMAGLFALIGLVTFGIGVTKS